MPIEGPGHEDVLAWVAAHQDALMRAIHRAWHELRAAGRALCDVVALASADAAPVRVGFTPRVALLASLPAATAAARKIAANRDPDHVVLCVVQQGRTYSWLICDHGTGDGCVPPPPVGEA